MSARDDRDKIAPGIYQDAVRRYATVHVRGAGFREKRFPLAQSLEEIEAWRRSERVKLLHTAERGTLPGSFARDANKYVQTFTTHLASYKSLRLEVAQWKKEFGNDPRGAITPAMVQAVRLKWLAAGLSPKTINNRVNTLARLYRCLDGKKQWTPCDELEPLHVHKTPIQRVSDETIRAVDLKLQQLEREKRILSPRPRARFRVIVSTGRRPSEVMRAEPTDVNLQQRVWIPRDGKGGYSPGIYLNDDMLAAWQFFIAVNAWGHFATDKQAEYLRLAGWPDNVRPYNARHTFGITLSEKGVDLPDIGAAMGHKRLETTRRQYVPVLNSRMQKVSEAMDGRFQGWPELQTSPQGVQTVMQTTRARSRKNVREIADAAKPPKTTSGARKSRIPSMKRTRKK